MEEEVKKHQDLKELKVKLDQQIKYLKGKAALSETDVYNLSKNFFKELLDLEYEFSHEELLDELHQTYIDQDTRDSITTFVEQIGKIEYASTTKFSEEELHDLIRTFEQIASKLLKEESSEKQHGRSMFSKHHASHMTEILASLQSETDEDKAKKLYKKALTQYDSLSEHEQEQYYQDLLTIYNKLKSTVSPSN